MPSRSTTPTSPRAKARSEGLIVEVGSGPMSPDEALALAKRVAEETLPGSWTVRRFADTDRTFEMFRGSGEAERGVGRYWEWAALLAERDDVADAEPALIVPGVDPSPSQVFTSAERAAQPTSIVGSTDFPCSASSEWALDLCSTRQGWAVSPPDRRHGRGIRVGHPDTGYTRHPDFFDAARILVSQGHDFEAGDNDPEDELKGKAPGHGSATGSVILSDEGPSGSPHVTGVAPAAELIPLRVSTSVVHLSFRKLAEAIHFAADKPEATRPHILSMSLGGPIGKRYLRKALRKAIERGIIPIAAAGNVWPFVVFPARYREVLGVAACNCLSSPWSGSAAGSKVDMSAPGESVWRARARKGGIFSVERSNGTSYATGMTAGACALWLAHHGYDQLVARYGRPNLATVFNHVLLGSGISTPAGWDTGRYGAGILNVEGLLRAALPPSVPTSVMPSIAATGPVHGLAEYFPDLDPAKVREAVREVLQVSDQELDSALEALGDELEFHVATNPEFRARIEALASPGPAGVMPTSAPPPSKLLGKEASGRLLARVR